MPPKLRRAHLIMLLGAAFQGSLVWGQFAAPISSTGVEAADARRAARQNEEHAYNFKLGHVEFRFNGGLRQEYNDNIGLSATTEQDDFITTPHVGMEADWPLSQLNHLSLSLDLAFSKYWNHSDLDSSTVLIRPGSLLNLDIYVRDIRFNLHDIIALQQDPTEVPQLSRISTFRRLTNTVGISAEWDLNKLLLQTGYDHDTFTSLESRFDTLDHSTDRFYAKAGCRVASQWTVGVLGNYTLTDYEKPFQNNSSGYSAGVFADTVISDYLRGSGEVRFQGTSFDRGGAILDNQDFGAVVFSFSLDNQLNRFIHHSAEVRRMTEPGIGSNFTDVYELNYRATAEVIRHVSSSLNLFFQYYEDSGSSTADQGIRYGVAPQFEYQLFEQTSLTLGYQYLAKDSKKPFDYEQNRVFIDVIHQF